jgi:hypothetical protein
MTPASASECYKLIRVHRRGVAALGSAAALGKGHCSCGIADACDSKTATSPYICRAAALGVVDCHIVGGRMAGGPRAPPFRADPPETVAALPAPPTQEGAVNTR